MNAQPPRSSSLGPRGPPRKRPGGGERGRRDALAVRLADDAEPHRGRDEVRGEGEAKGFQRGGEIKRLDASRRPDRDRIGDVAVGQAAKDRLGPCGPQGRHEGIAHAGRLKQPLTRRAEGQREIVDLRERRTVPVTRGRPGGSQHDGVLPHRTWAARSAIQSVRACGVFDQTRVDRRFEPVRIGKTTDRKSRREPDQKWQFGKAASACISRGDGACERGHGRGRACRAVVMFAMGMLVVVMPMIVLVMCMLMAVIVVVVLVVVVLVTVMGGFGRGRIGAALRIKGRLDGSDLGAEPAQHVLDDVVAPNPDRIGEHLRGQMPITDMPGEPHQIDRLAAPHLDQRFGGRHDLDEATVIQRQRVAAAQHHGLRQIEQEFEPAHPHHGDATAVSLVEIEHHGVGWGFGPAVLRANGGGADQGAKLRSGLVEQVGFLRQEVVIQRLLEGEGGLLGKKREIDPSLFGGKETSRQVAAVEDLGREAL